MLPLFPGDGIDPEGFFHHGSGLEESVVAAGLEPVVDGVLGETEASRSLGGCQQLSSGDVCLELVNPYCETFDFSSLGGEEIREPR